MLIRKDLENILAQILHKYHSYVLTLYNVKKNHYKKSVKTWEIAKQK